jgi:hypothetical protein
MATTRYRLQPGVVLGDTENFVEPGVVYDGAPPLRTGERHVMLFHPSDATRVQLLPLRLLERVDA